MTAIKRWCFNLTSVDLRVQGDRSSSTAEGAAALSAAAVPAGTAAAQLNTEAAKGALPALPGAAPAARGASEREVEYKELLHSILQQISPGGASWEHSGSRRLAPHRALLCAAAACACTNKPWPVYFASLVIVDLRSPCRRLPRCARAHRP